MKQPVEHTITFDNTRYHQNSAMVAWCEKNIGYGQWLSGTPKTWEGLERLKWSIDSMFGTTTFAFKDSKDAVMFALYWS